VLALLCGAPQCLAGENWPQFRGPNGDGISDATHLPLHWSDTENVKWKTDVHGKAWSSPVIWGNQVWMTTATPDGHELFAVCLDKDTGKIIYDLKLFDIANPQFCISFNSYASPTPCIEEGRVYVTFGSPGTACLDTKTGKVLWTRTDFVCNHFRGAGSSPLMYKNLLIMNFDGSDYQFVAALDRETGRTVWKTPRSIDFGDIQPDGKPKAEGDFRKGFSTPRVFKIDGNDVLVSLGSKAIYAYEPLTGKELWNVIYRDSHSGSDTPVYGDGLIFYGSGHGASELMALRPAKVVGQTPVVVWKYFKKVPTRSSVLLLDDILYMVTDVGIASARDAKTGTEIWVHRIEGKFSASPVYAAGRIYFFSEDGQITVIAPGREYKELAQNQLPGGTMAGPAVSGDSLFVRTRTAVYRVEEAGK
jgi:outer membrane protein assembly factor BamB